MHMMDLPNSLSHLPPAGNVAIADHALEDQFTDLAPPLTARQAAIEAAMHPATEVPVRTAESARAVLELCVPAAETTNTSTLSDVAVATHLALAATRAGADHAQLNIASLKDESFAADMRQRVARALAGAEQTATQALAAVQARGQG